MVTLPPPDSTAPTAASVEATEKHAVQPFGEPSWWPPSPPSGFSPAEKVV
jgi:hypothetical protein